MNIALERKLFLFLEVQKNMVNGIERKRKNSFIFLVKKLFNQITDLYSKIIILEDSTKTMSNLLKIRNEKLVFYEKLQKQGRISPEKVTELKIEILETILKIKENKKQLLESILELHFISGIQLVH